MEAIYIDIDSPAYRKLGIFEGSEHSLHIFIFFPRVEIEVYIQFKLAAGSNKFYIMDIKVHHWYLIDLGLNKIKN